MASGNAKRSVSQIYFRIIQINDYNFRGMNFIEKRGQLQLHSMNKFTNIMSGKYRK